MVPPVPEPATLALLAVALGALLAMRRGVLRPRAADAWGWTVTYFRSNAFSSPRSPSPSDPAAPFNRSIDISVS